MSTDDDLPPELDDRDHAVIAAVRGLDRSGAPDWAALEASIVAATTRAPRHRRTYLVGAALGVAAIAAAVTFYLARPRGHLDLTIAAAPAPAVVAPIEQPPPSDDDAIAIEDPDDSDLGAMGEIDDDLVDQVIALEDAADDGADESDDLPAIGAAWTSWIDDFSDDDLDQALRWLDTQEAT